MQFGLIKELPSRRLLLVHAHPDDETITNGATMARYAAEGVDITLVTCTRGEQGEVIPPELAHLAPEVGDGLGPYREGELAVALAALGVRDVRFLGDPAVRYRDSGMAYAADGSVVPAADPPAGAFALAPVDEAAAYLADVVREIRPQVVVTYDPFGGYGHPDHVQTHRVTMRAVDLAAQDGDSAPGWYVEKVYWTVRPDQDPTTRIDASAWTSAKVAAMRAHATQILVVDEGSAFELSNGVRQPISGVELYRLVRGEPGGQPDPNGHETDLFAVP